MKKDEIRIVRNVGKLFCAVVALVLVLTMGIFTRTQIRHWALSKGTRSALSGSRGGSPYKAEKTRKVYPLSVIPGGSFSSEELARSRRVDAVVAKHYAGFGNAITVQKTVQDTYMYVSYRKEDHVYWTQTKHRIPSGEYVLTDGKNFARARCGNRLSPVPQEPVMNAGEPGDDRLDKPEAPGDTYLADLIPPKSEPLYSLLPSSEGQPMLDVLNDAPRPMTSPSATAGDDATGSPFMGGRSFVGSVAYPRLANVASKGSTSPSSSPGVQLISNNTPFISSVPGVGSVGGDPVLSTFVADTATPEPVNSILFAVGGGSILLLIRARQLIDASLG